MILAAVGKKKKQVLASWAFHAVALSSHVRAPGKPPHTAWVVALHRQTSLLMAVGESGWIYNWGRIWPIFKYIKCWPVSGGSEAEIDELSAQIPENEIPQTTSHHLLCISAKSWDFPSCLCIQRFVLIGNAHSDTHRQFGKPLLWVLSFISLAVCFDGNWGGKCHRGHSQWKQWAFLHSPSQAASSTELPVASQEHSLWSLQAPPR